ncbi:MAG: S9 family peptidase [Ignavibacteriae bacterium]|nr:MAG: S9 family peptidase [Ignavibacteriota bacterium]
MHFKKNFFFFVLLFSISVFAQKDFTLQQVILEAPSLSPASLNQLQWIPGTDEFSYVEESENGMELVAETIESGSKKILTSLDVMNGSLANSLLDSLTRFPSFTWYNTNEIWFWLQNKLVLFNINNTKATVLNEISEGGSNHEFIVPGKIAYTIDNNLFIADNSNQIQVTFDENPEILNGKAVHRYEFGITKGIFWSPNSNYLAFYCKDETMVTDYPLVDVTQKPAVLVNNKYPMAGMPSHHVKVGVYNLSTGETTWLNTGEPKEQYLPGVTWSPDERFIFINVLNRDQNHLKVSKFNAKTGELVKVLFEETNEKYVEPEQGPMFFEDEPDMFIWQSRNEGWKQLSLYDASGTRILKLTKGEWEVTDFDGFDKSGTNIYFTSTQESPLERHYYKLSLDSYNIKIITNEPGTHKVLKNPYGKYFLDTYSSSSVPYRVDLLNKDGELIRMIYEAPNPLDGYNVGSTEILKLKSNDGYDLYGRIIRPPAFIETKKYPVLVYVYGGPHVQKVTDSWLAGANLWLNYMAQQGFVVFTVDNRGSGNRGLEFEQTIFRQLGTVEIEDQLTGIEYLKSLPFVDADRIGVYGWSYGGFMATSLMIRIPGVYKVGVGGGAVIDWQYYEVMYTERYMDTPQENPEGYEKSSLLSYAENLEGKLLLVHGTSDPTVVWQHTLLFAQKVANLGIDMDYYPYIGHGHGVRGKDKFHLYQKITNYFKDNL